MAYSYSYVTCALFSPHPPLERHLPLLLPPRLLQRPRPARRRPRRRRRRHQRVVRIRRRGGRSARRRTARTSTKVSGGSRASCANEFGLTHVCGCVFLCLVLKQVHPDTGISNKAMAILNSFVNDIFERIATEASSMSSSLVACSYVS